jgi:beta-glucosidase
MTARPALDLPARLRFGASSSAYQIEGAVATDGRGESIWDRFCRVPGAIADGSTGEVACDHYRRWRGDVALMAELGLEAYRFSIAWARVQPDGRGALERRGVEFYRRLASALRERGIEPVVTLHHADVPAALQDRGGWAARETVARFADYAGRVADELGDLVAAWITHNEPWGVAIVGHAEGTKAPGLHDWPTALRVAHHLLVSHGAAVGAVRARAPEAPVGISLNLGVVRPATPSPADAEAARRWDGFVNRWFVDPLLRGRYPDDLLELLHRRVGHFEVRDGDLELAAAPVDFLGVNAYHPDYVRAGADRHPLGVERVAAPPPTSPLGWRIEPDALRELLVRLAREYGAPPIWITENGVPDDPTVSFEGAVADDQRIAYLEGHLQAVSAAIAEGADVRRYFVWSLLDSFEWELGYRAPFGLVHVDFATQERTLKRSAHWYREAIAGARARAARGAK